MKSQTRVGFWIILGLAGLLVGIILGMEWSGTYRLPTRGGIQTTVRIQGVPQAQNWLNEAAIAFNSNNLQLQIEILPPLRGVDAARQYNQTNLSLPDIWINESEWVGGLAAGHYQMADQLASDQLVWVAATQRGKEVQPLDWAGIQAKAESDLQFRAALPPLNSSEALASCVSAAASYFQTTALSTVNLSDRGFQAWYKNILDSNSNSAKTPADLLSSRPAAADVGLLLQSQAAVLDSNMPQQAPQFAIPLNYSSYRRTQWSELENSQAAGQQIATEQVLNFLRGRSRDLQTELKLQKVQIAKPIELDANVVRQLGWCWQ